MEAAVIKRERRIVKNGPNGIGTMFWLDNGEGPEAGFSSLKFNRLILRKEPVDNIYVCAFQVQGQVLTELFKLPFKDFIKKYSNPNEVVNFIPHSEILFELSIKIENWLVLLSDITKFNYADISDFEMEMHYELH